MIKQQIYCDRCGKAINDSMCCFQVKLKTKILKEDFKDSAVWHICSDCMDDLSAPEKEVQWACDRNIYSD